MYFFKNKNDCLCKLLIEYKKIFIFWVGYTIIALRTFFSWILKCTITDRLHFGVGMQKYFWSE